MCGIVGLYQNKGFVDPERLLNAAQTLSHRGPDNSDNFVDRSFGMAHTRLSIIDLAGGDQPLFARNDELVLIANGEIYNFIELRQNFEKRGHHFITNSDSEVILNAYMEFGKDFLKVLNGMFAFALYDKVEQRLILARDRLGIKPLFIAHFANGIAFSSELKALLRLNQDTPEINPAGLIEYIQNQFSSERKTVICGYERILPGEAICIERGIIKDRWSYWSAKTVTPVDIDLVPAMEEFDQLMEKVMTEHMRSDVPFGLFLSGGVDSSILLSLLSRYKEEPVRTFSIGFSGTQLQDELPMAERLAQHFGSQHTSIRPDPIAIFHSLPYTIWAADELMRDYASLPTALLSQAAGKNLKVVFSGEGGDEVFAGYGRYRQSKLERWFKNILRPGSGGFRTRGTLRNRWPQHLLSPQLLNQMNNTRLPFINAWRSTPSNWSRLQRMQYVDIVTALPDNLLVKLDRMLMGWSLEGRVPFLDHRVVEFGLALPDQLKSDSRQGKIFLKRWARQYLPKGHRFGPKLGFYVPINEWISGSFLTSLIDILPRHSAIQAWFQPRGVRHLLESCQGSKSSVRVVWTLLQFAIWYQMFIDGKGERPPVKMDPIEFLAG